MSDLWTKANEIGDAIGNFNPVFQGIGAFTKMQVDHFDNHLTRNRNAVTGELEINPFMRYLGKRPEYVEKAYGRQLESLDAAKKLKQAGGSLEREPGKFLTVEEVGRRSDLATSDVGQKAQLLNIPINFGTDSAVSLAGKVERKGLRNEIEALGGVTPDGATAPELRRLKNQATRKDKRASAVFDAGTEIDVEAKSLGLGDGATPEEIRAKEAANFAEDYRAKDDLYEASGKGIREQESHKSGLAVNAQNIASARNADTLANAQFVENRRINDLQFKYNKFADDRNFRQRVLEGNQALDMRKFELEMQRDMSEDARQAGNDSTT